MDSERDAFDAVLKSRFFRDYTEAFQEMTGSPLRFIPSGGAANDAGQGSGDGAFCGLLHELSGEGLCRRTHAAAITRAVKRGGCHESSCFAGLTSIALPVVIGRQCVGAFFFGQVFLREPTQADFDRALARLPKCSPALAKKRGRGRQKLAEAYFQTPVLSSKKFQSLIHLATTFVQHLAEYGHRRSLAAEEGESAFVRSAKKYIHANFGRKLTLRNLAGEMHLSHARCCSLFKEATGTTFTDYVNRLRVETARELLRNRAMGMKQVAAKAGFFSIAQFNRVFKRFTGLSPSRFRGKNSAQKSKLARID